MKPAESTPPIAKEPEVTGLSEVREKLEEIIRGGGPGGAFSSDATVRRLHMQQLAREGIALLESEQEKRPAVVCLCGSSRFVDVFAVVAWELEKLGKIVHSIHLLPGWYCGDVEDHMAEAQGVAEILDELHLRKIDLSDEVWVIDVDGYIGESTSNEIAYAKSLGKPITFLSESVFATLGTESENGEGK